MKAGLVIKKLVDRNIFATSNQTLDETLALVDAVTPDDIAHIAAEFFAPEKQTVLSLGPAPVL